ncbi:MAG: tetratricopeptide repeat protein [Planctomycetes bacterium]|nr:tetratricopeptide repeat protein [Planctomycetota bacterium]
MDAVRFDAGRPSGSARRAAPGPLLVIVAGALAAAICATRAGADLIVLKNGQRIQARVIARGEKTTQLELPYGRLSIPSRDIASIETERIDAYLADQADALARQGSFARALALYEEAIRIHPESLKLRARSLDVRARQGEWLLSVGRLDEARDAFRHIIEESPGHRAAGEGLAGVEETVRWAREEIVRGREALKRREWAAAIDHIAPVHDRIPAARAEIRRPLAAAHARLGDDHLSASRFGDALVRYETALAIDPDLIAALANRYVLARIRCSVPLLEKGEFESARAQLSDALAILPDAGALKYYLALAYEGLGKPTEAAELYASIAGAEGRPIDASREIDILRRRAEEDLGLLPDVEDARWTARSDGEAVLTSDHFRIHHRNRFAAAEVARAAEAWLRRISALVPPRGPWPKPCDIHLHPDAASYRKAAGLPEWSGGATTIERRLGVCLSHRVHLYLGSKQLIPSVIPHEMGHVVLAWALGYDVSPPLWADEGFAVDREPAYKHAYFQRILQEGMREGRLLSMEDLLASKKYADDPKLFYAQSHAVTRFIIDRKGLPAFIAFLRDLDPTRPEEALRKHYAIDTISELENLWLRRMEWLRRVEAARGAGT